VKSTFASGLNGPEGLAVDSAGDLFEADHGSGKIYEFTPGGTRSTFASGLSGPCALAFNSAGDLF
jgi:glucose/arabinose dehydrogenase